MQNFAWDRRETFEDREQQEMDSISDESSEFRRNARMFERPWWSLESLWCKYIRLSSFSAHANASFQTKTLIQIQQNQENSQQYEGEVWRANHFSGNAVTEALCLWAF